MSKPVFRPPSPEALSAEANAYLEKVQGKTRRHRQDLLYEIPRILDEHWRAHGRMKPINDLAKQLGIQRPYVRDLLCDLLTAGWVERVGRGQYVPLALPGSPQEALRTREQGARKPP